MPLSHNDILSIELRAGIGASPVTLSRGEYEALMDRYKHTIDENEREDLRDDIEFWKDEARSVEHALEEANEQLERREDEIEELEQKIKQLEKECAHVG
jgi:predicted  nucleic acid-binding Zn-ribbon protein